MGYQFGILIIQSLHCELDNSPESCPLVSWKDTLRNATFYPQQNKNYKIKHSETQWSQNIILNCWTN